MVDLTDSKSGMSNPRRKERSGSSSALGSGGGEQGSSQIEENELHLFGVSDQLDIVFMTEASHEQDTERWDGSDVVFMTKCA